MVIPILLIIFNRPKQTNQVMNMIRKYKPKDLFIASDGPRESNIRDQQLCKETKNIALSIDWECEVHTLFRDQNLGCGLGPSSAITWFFENVDEGIILEDDCLPSISFFKFCEELLAYYRENPKIMHISGNNFQYGRKRGNASYYFSRYSHNWGWATWRRAWKFFDYSIIPMDERKQIWDMQWELSIEKHKGVSILPNINLVQNIGFGPDATHTKQIARYSFLQAQEISFPITHPKRIKINRNADRFTIYSHYRNIPNLKFIWYYQLVDYLNTLKEFLLRLVFYLWKNLPNSWRLIIRKVFKKL